MAIKNFTVQDATAMYGVKEWGYGFFGVNSKGHLEVHPTRDENLSCDVFEIVQHLRKKGADTPLILRFPHRKPILNLPHPNRRQSKPR